VLANTGSQLWRMDGSFLRDNVGNESQPFRGVDIHPGAEIVIWTAPGGQFAPPSGVTEDDETLYWKSPSDGQPRQEPGKQTAFFLIYLLQM